MASSSDGAAGSSQKLAGDYYSKLIDDQLIEERSRKASLEQRAGGVITTSGAVVTLVFAFTALIKGGEGARLIGPAKVELLGALALLLAAIVLALLIGFPATYMEVDEASLEEHLEKSEWTNPDVADAQRGVATALVGIITSARRLNDKKANLLFAAVALEVAGIAALAVTAMTVALS